jgi:hypothetical protein
LILSARKSANDMIGFCLVDFDLTNDRTNETTHPDDLPSVNFYTKADIDAQNPPNPFDDLTADPILNAAVRDLITNISGGDLTGFAVDFVDIG